MKKQEERIYKFHLKMDAEMKQSLMNIPMFRKAGSISQLVTKVIILFSPDLEKIHMTGDQKYSKYEFVCPDREIERKSMYINLPEKAYRQLKILHHDLNYYSMAQLLRLILRLFLELAVMFGDALESKLVEIYREWKKTRDAMKYRWKPIEELLLFIYQKPRQSRFLTLYSRKFEPISIYRL